MRKETTSSRGPENISLRPERMRIMGIDPGLGATGFGLITINGAGEIVYRGSGVIRASSTLSFPQRLQYLYRRLAEEIRNYDPHLMGVENPFFAKNVKSAMLLGQARGLAILAAAEAGVEVHEYSPLEVKQAVVGYGRAAKEQVQSMICSLLDAPKNLKADAADALAVAVCLAHSYSWEKALHLLAARRPAMGAHSRNQDSARAEGRG